MHTQRGQKPAHLSHAAATLSRYAAAFVAFLVVVVATAFAASAAPTPSPSGTDKGARDGASGGPRLTIGIGPATKGRPDSRPFFSYQMMPGGSYSDLVSVENFGPTAQDVRIYSADLINTADGGMSAGLATDAKKDVGGWIAWKGLRNSVVHLPASTNGHPGKVEIPFTIQVPASATPGDHSGGIVASISTAGTNKTGQQIDLDQRIGTRVFIRVGGVANARLAFNNVKVDYKAPLNPFGKGSVLVTYSLTNAGNINLGARVSGSVNGLFHTFSRSGQVPDTGLLLPGSTIEAQVRIDGVRPTVWQRAHLKALPLSLGATGVDARPVEAAVSFWAVPWLLLVFALGTVLALIAVLMMLRRNRRSGRHARGTTSGPRPNPEVDADPVTVRS